MFLKKIKKLLIYFLNLILYWLSKIVPKDENIWIFGAWFGVKYADNSKYLFEYIGKNYPEIRVIWITNNEEILNKLKPKKQEVYKIYSMKSIFLGLRAKYGFVVHSNLVDLMPFMNNSKTRIIQLWHGIPLKKIGFDDKFAEKYRKNTFLKNKVFPFLEEKYDLIIACSEEDKNNFITSFDNQKVFITGYPRNDVLFRNKNIDKFTITYLPTFRDSIGDKIDLFSDYNFDIEKWKDILSQNNVVLNIKMHPVNEPKNELLEKYKSIENISFLDEIDVAEILPKTDILITDYSSVFFDYLLTNRPMIFAPFDYEKYIIKDRELYYDYDEVTPGPKCKNWDQVLEWVIKFKENPDLLKEEREIVKKRFHKFQDDKNCERVYEKIIEELK